MTAKNNVTKMKQPTKSLEEKLVLMQLELKVPKTEKNKFGNYNYRTAEGILGKIKSLKSYVGVSVRISDVVEVIGDRFYVKSAVILTNLEKADDQMVCCAYAREPASAKGQSEGQLTGTTSSYARKYALGAMFILDGTGQKDLDELDNEHKEHQDPTDPELVKKLTKVATETPEEFGEFYKSLSEADRNSIDAATNEDINKILSGKI